MICYRFGVTALVKNIGDEEHGSEKGAHTEIYESTADASRVKVA